MSEITQAKSDRASVFSWCLYDWGNSAFATVIITFIFSVYFGRGIVGDETLGAAQWGMAIATSGLLIALISPFLGAVADHYGARKPWVLLFTLLCAVPTALLYFGLPHDSAGGGVTNMLLVMVLIVLANTAFEIALVFNNAMLPHLTHPEKLGRVSGWAWGMGYAGGLVCLVLSLVLLVGLGDRPPLLGLSQEDSQNIRAVGPLVAIWIVIFTIPMMMYTRDVPRSALSLGQAMGKGLVQLKDTFKHLRRQGNLTRFLISSAIYRDGLNTLFAMGGLYAAGTFGMSFQEILIFAIGLNIFSGIGAAGFAYMDDLRGSKQTVILSLSGLLVSGIAILLVQDKTLFMALAMGMGLFIGPVQSASRTMAARLSPPEQVGQTFGIYALTGRVASFFGPAVFAWAVLEFSSQRAGMATILLFWLAGLVLLSTVKEQEPVE
jgi:UMF1 family MFS transporter